MDFIHHWDSYIFNPFGFVIAIILITGFFSLMKERSRQSTIREVIKSGQALDSATLESLSESDSNNNGGLILAGLIMIAVAGGLSFMGYQIGKTNGDDEVFGILIGVASIPFLIGLVFLGYGAVTAGSKKSDS